MFTDRLLDSVPYVLIQWVWVGHKICIFNMLLGDADTAGPVTNVWKALLWDEVPDA